MPDALLVDSTLEMIGDVIDLIIFVIDFSLYTYRLYNPNNASSCMNITNFIVFITYSYYSSDIQIKITPNKLHETYPIWKWYAPTL